MEPKGVADHPGGVPYRIPCPSKLQEPTNVSI
jgi:hypothetical protein